MSSHGMKFLNGVSTLNCDSSWQVESSGQIMPSSSPQLREPLPFMHTVIVTVTERCEGLWKIITYNTQTVLSFEKSTVISSDAKLPEFLTDEVVF